MKWNKRIIEYLKWDIRQITLAGILLSLALASYAFKFKMGSMNITFDYLFYILFAFMLPLDKGMIMALITDTLLSMIRGYFGIWLWSFAFLGVFIVIAVKGLNYLFYKRPLKSWVFVVNVLSVFISMSIILLDKFYFKSETSSSMIVLLSFIAMHIVITGIFLFKMSLEERISELTKVYTIISILLVALLWVIGPLNMIFYWNYVGVTEYQLNGDDYLVLLIPRIAKYIIEVPIFTAIVMAFVKMKKNIPFLKGNNYYF